MVMDPEAALRSTLWEMKLATQNTTIVCSKGGIGYMSFRDGFATSKESPILNNESRPASCGLCHSSKHPLHDKKTKSAPCLPVAGESPHWKGSSFVTVGGRPALHMGSTFKCAVGGTISFELPQSHVDISG